MFVLSSVAYAISFLSQMAISFYFGTSKSLDSYLTLIAAASFLLFYINPIRDALIKIVFNIKAKNNQEASMVFSSAIILQLLLSNLSIVFFFLNPISDLLNVTSKGVASNNLLFAFLPYFFLFGASETTNGLLLSFNKLKYQAVARLISSLIGLICILLLAKKYGIFALLISLQLTQLVSLIVSSYGLYKEGIRFIWINPMVILKSPGFLPIFSSLIFSYFFAQVYTVFERFTMMKMSTGLVASFQYSTALVNVGISIIVQPVLNIIWPKFMDQNIKGNELDLVKLTEKTVGILGYFLLIGCSFIFFNSFEFVKVIYSRGKFGAESINVTSEALRATIYTAIPIAIYGILSRILLTMGKVKQLGIASFSIAVTGILVIALSYYTNHFKLVYYHWFIGNLIGAIITFYMIKIIYKRFFSNRRQILLLLCKSIITVIIALFILQIFNNYFVCTNLFILLSIRALVYYLTVIILTYLLGMTNYFKILENEKNR